MDEQYKIQLGVEVNTDDIQSQINKADVKPVPIKIEIENLDEIKKQIQSLGKNDKRNTLTFNTDSLEASLKDVKNIIADIKTSIGTLDSKSGMKSLLSSINQISNALDKASGKFEELTADLKTLSNKDFSFNIGVNMGGSNPISRNTSYGNKVRTETLPQLKKQAAALENYFKEYYKIKDGFSAIWKLSSDRRFEKRQSDLFRLTKDLNDSSGSLKTQMATYKEYIAIIKEAAQLRGIDISSVTSGFSKTSEELIREAEDIQTGAKEAEESIERLKGVFGSSINSESLDSIVADLKEIKTALTDLSANTPLNQLRTSFDQLSNSITQLIQNCDKIKISLNDVGNAGANVGTNIGNELANDFNSGMESIQTSASETSGVITDLKKTLQSMKLDRSSIDAITNDIKELGFEATDASVKMKNGNFDITVKGVDSLGRAVTEIRHLNSATGEIKGVSRTISQSLKESETFAKQQKRAVTDLTNQINQINRAATDQNAARPIKETTHLNSLKDKYNEIISAIERMGSASNDTFEDERNKVRTLITEYKSLKSEYKNAENVALQMDGNDFASGLEIAKNKLAEFKAQAQGFSQLTSTIKELDIAIGGVGDVSSLKEFNNQLRVARSELSKVKTETSSVSEIKFKLTDTGFDSFEQEVARAHAAVEKLKNSTPELQIALKKLDTAMEAVNSADEAGDIQRLVVANKDYETALRQVYSQLKLHQQIENNTNKDASFEKAKEGALLRLKGLFSENSEAAKLFGSRLDEIQRELNECGDTKGLTKINREITNLGREIKTAGVQTQTFGQRFKKQWQQYTSYFSVASVFSYGTQALRSMFEQVKLIDSAMTELKKVTNETDSAYSKFLSNAATRSKEIGTTIDGLVSSTADFARLGYGFEDAQGLAEVANIYAVVGDEIEGVEGATESLISTMAAFKDEMNGMSETDFAMSIIDKFNEIGKLIA